MMRAMLSQPRAGSNLTGLSRDKLGSELGYFRAAVCVPMVDGHNERSVPICN
jgi:hypothetical protein